jgi:hypothetical protein
MSATKTTTSRRELIDTGTNKLFARRDSKGKFSDVTDVGKSLARDVKQGAKTKVRSGQGDKGDRARS